MYYYTQEGGLCPWRLLAVCLGSGKWVLLGHLSLALTANMFLFLFMARLPDGFTQLLNLTQLCLNDCFLEYVPGNFGRWVLLFRTQYVLVRNPCWLSYRMAIVWALQQFTVVSVKQNIYRVCNWSFLRDLQRFPTGTKSPPGFPLWHALIFSKIFSAINHLEDCTHVPCSVCLHSTP